MVNCLIKNLIEIKRKLSKLEDKLFEMVKRKKLKKKNFLFWMRQQAEKKNINFNEVLFCFLKNSEGLFSL